MSDARYEAWLRSEGVRWEFVPNVPLSRIDVKASLEAQARLDKRLDEEMVAKYAVAMDTGAVFPPLIAYDAGGRLILIGGNHRVAAADLAQKSHFDTYVVNTDDRYIIDRMTRSMNYALEGKAGTQDEALQQAIFLVTTYGKSAAEVARSFNLKAFNVENAVRRQKALKRIERLGISTKHINASIADHLGRLNDKPLVAVEQLRTATGMSTDMLKALVKEVTAKKSEDEQLNVITTWSRKPEVQARREQTRSGSVPRPQTLVRTRLFRLVSDMEHMLTQHTTPQSVQLTRSSDVDSLQPRWRDVNKKMENLLNAAKKSVVGSSHAAYPAAAKRR